MTHSIGFIALRVGLLPGRGLLERSGNAFAPRSHATR